MHRIKLLLLVVFCQFLLACSEEPSIEQVKEIDPIAKGQADAEAARYRKLVHLYVGKTVPYAQYEEIGAPETLSGTTNSQWIAYFPKANFTIVTNKQTDIVRIIYVGKREF